jgi:hypothetical protein
MDRSAERGLQHVALPTACTLVYSNVTGEALDAREARAMRGVLDDVARALGSLVTVYAADPGSGVPKAIEPVELIAGRFTRGAHFFVMKDGSELRQLSVRRGDLWTAITILKSTGVRFRRKRASE